MNLGEGQPAMVAGSATPANLRTPSWAAAAARLVGLALVYFAAAKIGLALAFRAEQVTSVWPPTGIALAAVLLFGYRVWPGVALGAFLVNLTANESVGVACGIALGNTLEAVAGAWLVRRAAGPGNPLAGLRGVVAWVGGAVLLATTVAATIGVTTLCLGKLHGWNEWGSLWWLWWFGDATGALLVGPLLLAWAHVQPPAWTRRRTLEAAALALGVGVVGMLIFEVPVGPVQVRHALVYGMIPIVCWAALRFGLHGVTAVSAVSTGFAIWLTLEGKGPFAIGDAHGSLVMLQIFAGVVSATGLALAGAEADRRRVVGALRDSELRYSSMVEAVPGMLYTNAPDGKCNFVNQVFYDFTGLPPGSALDDGWVQSLHPDDAARMKLRWQSCVATGVPFEGEFRMREYDGAYRWFTSRSLPVRDADGHIQLWVGACIDIDAQKQAEQRLREDERRKDLFLAGLGDELRDPLAPIRYAVHSLDARRPVEPDTRRMVGVIEREVGHMASLIDDLLDVSRIAQGRTRLRMEPCDLAAITTAAVERCRGELLRQDIQLSVSVPEQPVSTLGDPRRLTQVVDHVLRSAASLTDPGGTVSLELLADEDAAGAQLIVRHPGNGLEPQALAGLFEPADSLDPPSAALRGGLGLGLVLVRSLVEMHGGRVLRMADEPGPGSAFSLWLPLRRTGVPAFRP